MEDLAADHYLRRQGGELDWVRNAIRVVGMLEPPVDAVTPAQLEPIREEWVQGQENYFLRASRRDLTRNLRVKSLTRWFFLAGLLWTGARAFLPPSSPGMIALSLLLAVAFQVGVYSRFLALADHARRYGWMTRIFGDGTRRLSTLIRSGDTAGARVVLRELGREALAENGDWVLVHRDRPLEPPKG